MFPRKPLEHLFKLLPVLVGVPLVLLLIGVVLDTQSRPVYEAKGTMWVSERGTSGTTGQADVSLGAENVYASPSQRQTDALNQLMATQSFALTIAERSGLLDGTSDRQLEWRTIDFVEREAAAIAHVRRAVWSRSGGTNLMTVGATDTNPERALALSQSATDLYLERVSSEATRKTDLAVSFYQQRLDGARMTLDEIDRELTAYVAAHPRSSQLAGPAPFDPAFERLQASFSTQNMLVTSLQKDLELAQLDAATTAETQKGRYALVDAPTLPTAAVTKGLRARAMPLAIALGLGGALAGALLYVYIATDHSVRSSEDVVALGVPILAFLPEFDSRDARPWVARRFLRRDRAFARRLAANLVSIEPLERGA